ncbi:MAG: STAS domain-containing protein [Bacteroidales bacterium]|nr:STAS domain-containing protein [Bacteroidales bacterium]
MSEVIKENESVTIRPQCDVVASMASEFKTELKTLLDEGVQALTIDLTGVEMVDSVGLGVFIATHNSLHKAGGQLTVSQVSPDIAALFRTMRLDKHFNVMTVEKEPCHG